MEIGSILSESLTCMERARGIDPSSGTGLSALRWEVYASLQNLLDAMAMMIVELGAVKPSTYSELGRALQKSGLIGEGDAEVARRVAVTRNILAHAYRRLREEDLRRIVEEILPEAERLARKLIAILSQRNIDPAGTATLNREELSRLATVFKRHDVIAAYLFGSRARGIFRDDSDYDIAVVLREGGDIITEVNLSSEIADALEVPADRVDLVLLRGDEYPLIARVLKEGVPIYEESEAARKAWEKKVYLKILLEMDLHEIYQRKQLYGD